MSSFLKYDQDVAQNGAEPQHNGRGPVSFSRAHVDGMPFRGPSLPLKEDEYRQYTEVVRDFDAKVFDIRDPEQHREFREIFDRATNGWYDILDVDKRWGETANGEPTVFVFVMYAVPHRELAKNRTTAELLPESVPTI